MRQRFQKPIGDDRDPAFVALCVRAGMTDSADREPAPLDYLYWQAEWRHLVDRGHEIGHPHYEWDRLIGWQAGEQAGTEGDRARYGPYAHPPNSGPVGGWVTPFVDVPGDPSPGDGIPSEPPTLSPPLAPNQIAGLLNIIITEQERLNAVVPSALDSLRTEIAVMAGEVRGSRQEFAVAVNAVRVLLKDVQLEGTLDKHGAILLTPRKG